jgi:tetratricopeptide (TPR) repeat protein
VIVPFALLLLLTEDPEALSSKAVQLAQQQRTDEAEKLWRQALALQPDLFSAAFNLGYLYYTRKDCAAAVPFLSKAAAAQPKDFNAQYLSGVCLSQLGRTEDALRRWRAALALRPDQVKLMQVMAVEYSKGRYYREAAAIAQRALSVSASDPGIYLLAVKALEDARDYAQALPIAEKFRARFPDHPRANFEYGFLLHRTGRSTDALPYLEKAMSATPPWEEPFFFAAEILMQHGRTTEAVAHLRRAIELRPDYMVARVTLARALMALGKDEEAKAELLSAVKQDPRHPQPHLLLSQLYFRLGDEDAAGREKSLSLKLRRENPEALEQQPGRPFPRGDASTAGPR